MGPVVELKTSPSLLGRLRHNPGDEDAWAEFERRYRPRIHQWCRQWKLQEADAHDVTQNVLLKLIKNLQSFHYDPNGSFRAWLQTVTRHTWYEFGQCRDGAGQGTGDSHVLSMLHTIEAREDLLQRLDEEFDRELVEEAMARVRLQVEPTTWQAFIQTAIQRRPAHEVAAELGVTVNQVYVHKSRVLERLVHQVKKMGGADLA